MSTALMPLSRIPGRPSIIDVRGCKVYISVHDAWHDAQLRELKALIRDCHPDRRKFTKIGLGHQASSIGGKRGRPASIRLTRDVKQVSRHCTTPFLIAQDRMARFMEQEIKWYAQYGMVPPSVAAQEVQI